MTADDQEREASLFAMCLLMPEKFVRDWIKANPLSLEDDHTLKQFARDFNVPLVAAAARLADLGYFDGAFHEKRKR